ncbi:MAG: ABC transporter ATP-binding protein [Candidatus Lokiarchaeota archaeon]|nr:ABC transporter ATP-binding protein [Candidatus Lokiarchaeota archaeon]
MKGNYEIWTKNLTKVYDKRSKQTRAVDCINLRVEPGVHGFLGPNGAGKTTTINMLMGAISITSGEAYVRGLKAGSIRARRMIGFLPQDPIFYGNMTAHEYLLYTARLFGLKKRDAINKTEELLEYFKLSEEKKKPISKFSGGMKQKVGLASTLIHDPKLLILDEPTTNLDPIGRKKIIEYVKKLAQDISIFVSSHILSEIEQMCENVTIINDGKIVLINTIQNIKNTYSSSSDLFIIDTNGNQMVLRELEQAEGVLRAWISEEDTKIHVVHNQGEKLQEIISNLIAREKIVLKSFYQPEASLQEVFINLMKNGDG